MTIQNKLSLFSLLFSFFIFSSCSTTKGLTEELENEFDTAKAFEHNFTGFMLYDPESKKVIFEKNSEKYFTPASNTKLFTFFTGVSVLGDSIPALKYAVRNDSLVFWGTGDPSFLHRKLPDSKVLEFLKNRKEKLFYAAPNYEPEHFGPGWSWDDYNWYYSVERGAFPIFGNYVTFTFSPQNSVPHTSPSIFQDSIQPSKESISRRSSVAVRNLSKNVFQYQHEKGKDEYVQEVPFIYSSELITKILSDTLDRKVTFLKQIPEGFKPENILFSIPSDSVYKRMLQVSDNFLAEQVLIMSSGMLSDTLDPEIAIDYMKENQLQDLPDEPVWVDGSGLSAYNLFTPRDIVKLLEKIAEVVPQERLFNMLPNGGVSGTLQNLFKAEEPYIFAKTGTLSHSRALSGFLKTKKGKILIFSFLHDNYVVPTSEINAEMEKILKNIHLNY